MRPRRKCEFCGKKVSYPEVKYRTINKMRILCSSCSHAEGLLKMCLGRAIKRKQFEGRTCVVCGNTIQWKPQYYKKNPVRWPTTCCTHCHGVYSKREAVLTKERCIERIEEYVKAVGHPCTVEEVLHGAHIASKVLTRHKISILAVQKKIFGLSVDRVHADITAVKVVDLPTLDSINSELDLHAETYQELCDTILSMHRSKQITITTELIERVYLSFIGHQKHYVPKTVIVHELFHKNWTVEMALRGIDSASINWKAGYKNPKRSWYELEASIYLREKFGASNVSAEHTFPDCRSTKDFPLRFDFYIPEHRLLIEIDGNQHSDKDNRYHTEQLEINDAIKEEYATQNNYKLVRVPTTPRFTFTSRLEEAIMDVLKPVELLEALPDTVEGNQQPRSRPESIQMEFDF